MPEFHIKQGSMADEVISLPVKRIVVGRSNESTLLLPDASVDLTHASLEYRVDRWILQDLGAPGGTWLNDEEVDKPCRVFDGDIILFGEIPVEVQGVGGPLDLRDQYRATKPLTTIVEPMPKSGRASLLFILVAFIVISLVVALVSVGGFDLSLSF
ncbi:MAG: FHA domain-containing protein [Chloroflexota bacterium]